jgi:Ni,Fe-hydrogenase III small subunit
MENPLSIVKQTRTVWNRELERPVVEVQVEVSGAPKSWIPMELLEALANLNPNQNEQEDKTAVGTTTN